MGVFSTVTIVLTHIRGLIIVLIATNEPPSGVWGSAWRAGMFRVSLSPLWASESLNSPPNSEQEGSHPAPSSEGRKEGGTESARGGGWGWAGVGVLISWFGARECQESGFGLWGRARVYGSLGGSSVVISRVISRATMFIAHIRGRITTLITYNYP